MSALPPKIRVLVVDDSALARRSISDALSRDPAIAVVGFAADPYIARERILELEPDVITLDMEMPRMDGLTFLRILQEHHPVPVVVVSSLTQAGSELALQALEAGAIEVLAKPDGSASIGEIARQLIYGVKAAARSQGRAARALKVAAPMAPTALAYAGDATHQRLLLIGASTGGVEALRYLLPQLPANVPPIVVVQHIPANFSRIMAIHLDALCPFTVREASDGNLPHGEEEARKARGEKGHERRGHRLAADGVAAQRQRIVGHEDEDARIGQLSEDPARQLHRDISQADRALRNPRMGSGPSARLEGALEDTIQHRACHTAGERISVSVLGLAGDFGFADHLGI